MSETRTPFPGTYRDTYGTEPIEFLSDGRSLLVVVRGVALAGTDFDMLEPVNGAEAAARANLRLHHNCLCGCELTFHIPLKLSGPEGVSGAVLESRLVLGVPGPRGGLDQEDLHLRLSFGGKTYQSRGNTGWFEDELLDLARQLPEGVHLRACITCAFSDYSPYGHGLFGCLACFRDNKAEYLSVRDKTGIFRVWNTLTEYVQETYLCPEFQLRKPGTGYRG
ncbi:DUF6304 family protein [Vitiosangium sp. GDMCC 1.1324]|uniref:DUF6304 family protein n=1 Tax=Vitiosangium sp. (strain GDMCC 1.1324) TaxID=2138576 RepID=UPI000D3950DA|nr:DUF6304 family protein [Vitiosangium sp. GDMCC 1.1324]PTL85622.1 hypothetical protein DAT35_02600 [Vitiosangium sp. GDMCC 1.1324]